MPNFGYHFARAHGRAKREFYRALIRAGALSPLRKRAVDLPFEVYSYSGEESLPEQIASIRSFLGYGGRPRKWTVVSDGTHSVRSVEILRAIDSAVRVSSAGDWLPENVPAKLTSYFASHPTGKQLALTMSLPHDGAALYVDSDVLFFPGATELERLEGGTCYLADCRLSADERLFRAPKEKEQPVNSGVLFLSEKLDWSLGLQRLLELEGAPNFFTNQTVTHLTMQAHGAARFDPRKFVLQLDDQFVYPDKYAGADIVLRHYVHPVRHKFWTTLRA
ncbi:MAG: hypothetical protein LC642_06605 [Verrucomicrobiaceae bacterium]|nr:hypothetical protein [Verrucomicrobiaceae bacterium]